MPMKAATTAQKKWLSDITDYINENGLGRLYGLNFIGDCMMQRHHVLGRSARHNKIYIGHWFIIPIPFALHDPNMVHKHHVSHCKKAFVNRYGAQRELFSMMYQDMQEQGYNVPDITIYNAIMATGA